MKPVYSFFSPEGVLMQKHWDFNQTARAAARGENSYSFFFFGGGVRGGKTFCTLLTIIQICQEFPGMKCHIIRETMPDLIGTVGESLKKLMPPGTYKKMNRDKSNYYIEFFNGSRIYFFAENLTKDPDLDEWKGMETNLIFLEQIEGLSEKTFNKAIERFGSWRIENEPQPLIFSTFNPTHVEWVRNKIYDPYIEGTLADDYYVQFVLPQDNPHNKEHQMRNWKKMDDKMYRQYVLGDWNVLSDEKQWAYSFDKFRHIAQVELKKQPIYLSFDFNVNPITCLAAYINEGNKRTAEGVSIEVFREFRLENSNVYELCNEIRKIFNGTYFIVTGDASGRSRSVNVKDNITSYSIIQKELNVNNHRLQVPMKNLGLNDSRVVVNGTLDKLDVKIDPSCKHLIADLSSVKVTEENKIDKKDGSKSHLFDCFRYFCNRYFYSNFL